MLRVKIVFASKVVSLAVLLDDLKLPSLVFLDCHCFARLYQEELFTNFAGHDDIFAIEKSARLKDVGDLGSFLRLEGCEDGNFREEFLVQSAFARGVLRIQVSCGPCVRRTGRFSRQEGSCEMKHDQEPKVYME